MNQIDTFLNSYKEKEGGPLKTVFDEKKAKDILARYLPSLPREGKCSCQDSHCPHKSNISPLGSFFMFNELNKCLKPTRGFLDAFQDIKRNSIGDLLEIPQTVNMSMPNPDVPEHTIYNNILNPGLKNDSYYKVKTIGRIDKDREIVPRSFIEIMEGIEIFDKKVKSIIFNFNGIPFFTFTIKEHKTYYEFLFPIIIRCLQFVILDILFLDKDKVQIFPEYSLIGGYYNRIDWTSYKEKYPFNYLGKKYEAIYSDGMFSISPYVEMKL